MIDKHLDGREAGGDQEGTEGSGFGGKNICLQPNMSEHLTSKVGLIVENCVEEIYT